MNISFSIFNGKWKIEYEHQFFICHFSLKMKNEKNGCSFSIFHFPLKMENGNNGMYTDREPRWPIYMTKTYFNTEKLMQLIGQYLCFRFLKISTR